MTFLNGWAIGLGIAGASLPVLIHFLTKPKPARMPLSTIRFVRMALRQRKARHRLRDAIVLLLRAAAALLLALAIARPLGKENLAAAARDEPSSRVVIVDVSASMGQVAGGVQLFERARSLAAGYLADKQGVAANLILAGATAKPVFDRLSTNFAALRSELQRASPKPQRLNVAAAVNQVAELLARAATDDQRQLQLVIVSDFQRANWATVDFAPLPKECQIQLESVAPREPQANLAVVSAGVQGRIENGRTARLDVEIGNYSAAARNVEAEATIGDETVRLQGLCLPGVKTMLSAEFSPKQTGWQTGEIRLLEVADALADDNARAFSLEVRPTPAYLLISRQPAMLRPSSSYYLERALAPAERRTGPTAGERVVRVDPDHLDQDALAAADVVVLDHPGKLSTEKLRMLAAYARRGRGVWYVAAEVIDASNLKLLADEAGADLQMPVEFIPAAARRRKGELFLTDVRRESPVFVVFGESLPSLVGPLRFSTALGSRRLQGGLADDIAASYSDRSACLVIASCGGGTLAVLNADLASSNLIQSTMFVPLVSELISRLLGQRQREQAFACGEPIAAYLPSRAGPAAGLAVALKPLSTLKSTEKADDPMPLQLAEDSSGVVLRSAGAPSPGLCLVQRGGAAVFAVATAVPEEEADLRGIDADVFTERLSAGRSVRFRSSATDDESRDPTWVWLAVGCACCLLAEWVTLRAFRT